MASRGHPVARRLTNCTDVVRGWRQYRDFAVRVLQSTPVQFCCHRRPGYRRGTGYSSARPGARTAGAGTGPAGSSTEPDGAARARAGTRERSLLRGDRGCRGTGTGARPQGLERPPTWREHPGRFHGTRHPRGSSRRHRGNRSGVAGWAAQRATHAAVGYHARCMDPSAGCRVLDRGWDGSHRQVSGSASAGPTWCQSHHFSASRWARRDGAGRDGRCRRHAGRRRHPASVRPHRRSVPPRGPYAVATTLRRIWGGHQRSACAQDCRSSQSRPGNPAGPAVGLRVVFVTRW